MNNKDIFNKAWSIATIAAFRYGGTKSEYFTESLKEAHKLAKTHCTVRKYNWNFSELNSYIEIKTPKGMQIIITKYIIKTRTQYSKWLLGIAKQSYVLLTEDEIAILINLSNQNF